MKPILKYPGAKWALASWVVRHLPQTPHYVEPFCGSAAVFFNLPWRPRHAVLNDLSGDIVNLFRVIRERGEELAALIEMTPWAREEYELSYEPTEEPVERARRFLVRTWQAHASGSLVGRSGWWHQLTAPRYSSQVDIWANVPMALWRATAALAKADIESRPAVDVIRDFLSPDVLIYADPPYVTHTRVAHASTPTK